jgi:retinol dehydrogenase-12
MGNNNHHNMSGKICMVTGATAGIGFETARQLAEMGAEVVVVGHNDEHLKNAVESIRQSTGNAKITPFNADLSSVQDIRKLADEFLSRYDRLDVLVNNAGGFFYSRKESPDGYEMTLALNHLNYFLLTNLLLDVLKKTALDQGEARIVNVSSGASMGGKIHFDDLQTEHGYSGWRAYSQSKLANILFTKELARRLDGAPVMVNALHPGFVASNFGHNNGPIIGTLLKLSQFFAKTPEEGAETSVYLASSPEVAGESGGYYAESKPVKPPEAANDPDTAAHLWEVSEKLVQSS